MNKIKKLSIAFFALALVTLLGVTVFAAANINYTATLDNESICVSDVDREATVTIQASQNVALIALDAQVVLPDGWSIVSIANSDLGFTDGDYSADGRIMWFSDANKTADELAVIKVEIPANTPAGEYTIGLKDVELARFDIQGGWSVLASGVTVTATLTINEHEYALDTTKGENGYEWSGAKETTACTAYGKCECGATTTVAANITRTVDTPATCLAAGKTKYTAGFSATWTGTQTKTVADIAQKEHSYTGVIRNDGDKHSFMCVNGCNLFGGAVDHDFANGDCECGAVALTVTTKGTITYTVNGRVVTVTHSAACKVGYLSGDKYVTTGITKTKISDTSYSFAIPAGVSEVLLVVIGDANGDTIFSNQDVTQTKLVYLERRTVSADIAFAMDVTGDGLVQNQDVTQIKLAYLGRRTFAW